MKLTGFLSSLVKVLKGISSILAIIILGFFVLFILYKTGLIEYDAREICIDDGKVWDGDLQKCRDDCLTWNEKDGCVPL